MTLSRVEDRRLITGHGCYTADWNLPDQLHGAMVRSDRAHAELLHVDLSAARSAPGVRAIIAAADLTAAGIKPFDWGVGYKGKGGQAMKRAAHPQLATSHVRFVGEPIVMVVADSAAQARDAAELVAIDYRDLSAVATMEDAAAPGAPQVHGNIPGNLAFEYEEGDRAATEDAFARAKFVAKLNMTSQRLVSNPMEPRAVMARWNVDGSLTMYTSSQGVGGMRAQLATCVGIPGDKIEIVAQDVGGSFGTRSVPFPEHCCVIAAAKKLGRPVKWVGSRSEAFLSDWHGRALRLKGELALAADGTFLGIRFDDSGDLGAYPSPFGAFIATKNLTITMGGAYRMPAMYASVSCYYTNTTPVSAYRCAGRPDIAYAIERLVDQAAAEFCFDRVELRRKNLITPAEMPYKTPNVTTYDCGEFAAIMDTALDAADWRGFTARRLASQALGKLRGFGFATYLEASGGGVAAKDQTQSRFDANGRLTLFANAQSSGQGHETSFVEIVARELGVPTSALTYRGSDSKAALVGNGTGGSRSLLGAGSSFKALAVKMIALGLPHAAQALECAEADIEYSDGGYRVKGSDRLIGFMDLATRLAAGLAATTPHPLDAVAEMSSGVTFPNGCHVAEVEVDPATGVTTVERYIAYDDAGTLISPQLVHGQMHGGITQGAGQVFGEHAIYDRESAQFMTGSFMDYPMPRAGWVQQLEMHERPVPTKTNALGAKGVGEAGCSGALPALMNAVIDAVRVRGIHHLDMPVTPSRLWAALNP